MSTEYQNKEEQTTGEELKWTGERFLPWAADLCLDTCYEHLHRYAFALQLVKGKKVLDIPCGEGYGADMLAGQADSVVAVDIDEQSTTHARNKYRRHNLEFLTGDMTSIPVKGQKIFDVIVCFEGIEHITEQADLLKEVKRLLKEDGIFLVSSPNKTYTSNHCGPNPYHHKELYFNEFDELLRTYFKEVNFYSQKVFAGSNIWPLSENSDQTGEFVIERGPGEFLFCGKDKKTAVLYMAVASDFPIIQNSGNSFLIDSSDSLMKLMAYNSKYMAKLQQQIEMKDSQITELKKNKKKDNPLKVMERAFRRKVIYPFMELMGLRKARQ